MEWLTDDVDKGGTVSVCSTHGYDMYMSQAESMLSNEQNSPSTDDNLLKKMWCYKHDKDNKKFASGSCKHKYETMLYVFLFKLKISESRTN